MFCRPNTTKSPPEAARPLSTKASARPLPPNRWRWCASPKAANYCNAPRATAPSQYRHGHAGGAVEKPLFRFGFAAPRPPFQQPAQQKGKQAQNSVQQGFQHIRVLHLSGTEKIFRPTMFLYISPPVCRASYPLFECRLLLPRFRTFKSSLHLQNAGHSAVFSAVRGPCFSAWLRLFRPRPFPTSPLCRPLPSLI